MVRKTVGRPKLATARKRSRSITFRVPPGLADRIEQAAQVNNRSLSEEIMERVDFADTFPAAMALARDVVSACRILGDWTDNKKKGQDVRTLVRLLVDAHSGVGPKDLLENKRHGSTEMRMLAYAILHDRAMKEQERLQ